MSALLELHQIHAAYGNAPALFGVSLEVASGECDVVMPVVGNDGCVAGVTPCQFVEIADLKLVSGVKICMLFMGV